MFLEFQTSSIMVLCIIRPTKQTTAMFTIHMVFHGSSKIANSRAFMRFSYQLMAAKQQQASSIASDNGSMQLKQTTAANRSLEND